MSIRLSPSLDRLCIVIPSPVPPPDRAWRIAGGQVTKQDPDEGGAPEGHQDGEEREAHLEAFHGREKRAPMSRARLIPSSPQQADHHRLDEELLQYVGLAGADGDGSLSPGCAPPPRPA